jgi:hypothetical protein
MSDNHFILNVHLEAVPGHEEELAQHLLGLVGPTRAEPGCLVYNLHRDPENPRTRRMTPRRTSKHGGRIGRRPRRIRLGRVL